MPVVAASPLATERAYFEAHRTQLVRECNGKWVVVKGEALMGVYETWEQAYVAGAKRFPGQLFMVRQVMPRDEPVVITRMVMPHNGQS